MGTYQQVVCESAGPRLFDQVRDVMRRRHYSLRTEHAYLHWVRRFILFNGKRHPSEMGPTEVTAVLAHLEGTSWLMASLLYGSGLRLTECLQLRVKDIDFPQRQLVVRHGKGPRTGPRPFPSDWSTRCKHIWPG